jgi:hypothetical protein
MKFARNVVPERIDPVIKTLFFSMLGHPVASNSIPYVFESELSELEILVIIFFNFLVRNYSIMG